MIYWTECLLKPMNLNLTWLDMSILSISPPHIYVMLFKASAEQWGTKIITNDGHCLPMLYSDFNWIHLNDIKLYLVKI